MNFKTRIAMESFPGFHVDAGLDPMDFRASVRGSCEATVDSVSLRVSAIPLRMAIPFLKRRRRYPVLGSVGGFQITLSPLHLKVGEMGLKLDGVLGTKGIAGRMDGKIDCKTEMHVDGHLAGKVGTVTLEFDHAEQADLKQSRD